MSENDQAMHRKNPKPWLTMYGNQFPEHVDFKPLTLMAMFKKIVKEFPDNTALNYKGYKVSYTLLLNMINTFSCCLKKFGIKRGDCVGIMLPNVISLVTSYYATLKIGGVAVMIDPDCELKELEYILNDASIKVVVTLDARANHLITLRKRTKVERVVYTSATDYLSPPFSILRRLIGLGKNQPMKVTPARDLYTWKNIMTERPLIVGEESIELHDSAMIFYTRDSEGRLQGVVLSHKNLSFHVQQINAWFNGFEKGRERILAATWLTQSFGVSVSMNWPIINGWELVLTAKIKSSVGSL